MLAVAVVAGSHVLGRSVAWAQVRAESAEKPQVLSGAARTAAYLKQIAESLQRIETSLQQIEETLANQSAANRL